MSSINDFYNERTGEQACGMLLVRNSKYPKGTKFATVFADGMLSLSAAPLKGTERKIISALIAMTGPH